MTLAVTACSGADTNQQRVARFDTLAGGRVEVTNTSTAAAPGASGWRLEEDLRIGTAAAGPAQFGRIGAVLADSRGTIYVLDLISQDIRVFDSTGSYTHTIGRKGEGPGEFTGAIGMSFGPGDTLWVTDPQNGRYSGFARDGTLLATRPRRITGFIDFQPGTFVRGRGLIDWGLGFPGEGQAVAGRHIIVQPIRLSGDFEQPDSLPPLEFDQEMAMIANQPRPVSFFSGGLTFTIDGRGDIWFGRTREYRIYRRTLDGDTTLVFTLPARAAAIDEADRDYVQTRMAYRPELLQDYLAALPEARPIIHRILSDGAGHVFVVPDVAGVPRGSVIDVFRDTGEFIARLGLPSPLPLLPPPTLVAYATRGYLYVVVPDETGVPFVARLRIVRGE